jgi:diguanylate cyclase (GGDEF)-like protein
MARVARTGEGLAVAMLDLDHFKEYNDTLGHRAGDRLLKHVAGAWSTQLRSFDLLARVGGEEFALALAGCNPSQAWATVERLRGAMPDGQACSAGIASWDGSEAAGELLDRADQALYSAKRNGRDQTAVAPDCTAPVGAAPLGGTEVAGSDDVGDLPNDVPTDLSSPGAGMS